MADQDKVLDEIRKRVIRTETRVMALGSKLGYDLKDEDEVTVMVESKSAYIAVMDVAYTTVVNRCRRAGLHGEKVKVFHNGALVAEMYV